jgi:transcriptional antiterminator NusG
MDWHIALAEPQRDRIAFAHLQRLQYRVYYPVFPVQRVLYGKKTVVYRPIFPSYLFVQRGANQDWFRLETAPGIRVTHSLLSLEAGRYATITSEEFEEIKAMAKELCEQVHDEPRVDCFRVGDEVKIKVGPFADFLATIIELDEDARSLTLRTFLFGRQVTIPRAKPDHLSAA